MIQITKLEPAIGEFGLILHLEGTKDSEFTITQARARIVGDLFWQAVTKSVGKIITTIFRFRRNPVYLVPIYIPVNNIKKGIQNVNFNVMFGVGENNYKRFDRAVIVEKLKRVVEMGDPEFKIVVTYGDNSFFNIFVTKGEIFTLTLRASFFLASLDQNQVIENTFTEDNSLTGVVVASRNELSSHEMVEITTEPEVIEANKIVVPFIKPIVLEEVIEIDIPPYFNYVVDGKDNEEP